MDTPKYLPKASCNAISIAANVPGKCGNSTLDSNMISWKWRISLPTKFATKEVFKFATVCSVVSPTTSSAGLPEP